MNYRILAALLLVLIVGINVAGAEDIFEILTPTPIPVFDNDTGEISKPLWDTVITPKENHTQPIRFLSLTYNSSRWHWSFGDGYESYEENPYHVYTKTGCYDVSLNASNNRYFMFNRITQHLCMRLQS